MDSNVATTSSSVPICVNQRTKEHEVRRVGMFSQNKCLLYKHFRYYCKNLDQHYTVPVLYYHGRKLKPETHNYNNLNALLRSV